MIIFHLIKLWKAKSFIPCDVYISGEAAWEVWNRSLLGVEGELCESWRCNFFHWHTNKLILSSKSFIHLSNIPVFNPFHFSIDVFGWISGWQVLAKRQSQCDEVDMDPSVWSNERVMKWCRSIDLGVCLDPFWTYVVIRTNIIAAIVLTRKARPHLYLMNCSNVVV